MYQNNESISSRLNQYPYPQNKIPREIHGPCGGHKFSGIFIRNNFGNNVCENKELYDDKVGNELFLKFKRAANIAVKSLRYINRNEEAVIDVEKEANADGVGFVAKRCENGEMGVEVEKMCGYLENGDSLVSSVQNRLARVHIDDYVEKLDEKGVSEDLLQKAFAPLTYEEKDEVYQALLPRNRRTVLVTHQSSNIEITSEVLKCLKLGQWLNDKVINVYLELLKEREKQEPEKFLKCHFFNTFFYKKLIGGKSGYDYKSVRRWTTQKKLGYNLVECDKIFIPIHKEAHWCLAVINNKDKKFHYLDSLRGIDAKVFRVLAMYYVMRSKTRVE